MSLVQSLVQEEQLLSIRHLKMMAEMEKHANHGLSVHQFVLDHGRMFTITPKSFPRTGKMKECFKNALALAIRRNLTYCEGYAINIIPTIHAWCIDKDGNVIDPTWENAKEYYGVPFQTDYVLDFTDRHGVYDSVVENWRDKWPLITGAIDPKTVIHEPGN